MKNVVIDGWNYEVDDVIEIICKLEGTFHKYENSNEKKAKRYWDLIHYFMDGLLKPYDVGPITDYKILSIYRKLHLHGIY